MAQAVGQYFGGDIFMKRVFMKKFFTMINRAALFGAAVVSALVILSGGVLAGEKTEPKTSSAESTGETAVLPDGEYEVTFETDSTMFRINEALHDTALLTVKDGEMTVHITLVSKNIVNLFPGLAEDAVKDGAVLLEPTEDDVTYSDGMTDTVYGFDVPVPALDEEFDLALVGKKGKWYDHKVVVSF
jgi:hypothetical protein